MHFERITTFSARKVAIGNIILLLVFGDFVFLHIGYWLDIPVGLNVWKEILIVIFLLYAAILALSDINFREQRFAFAFAFGSIIILVAYGSLRYGDLRSFRSLVSPVMLAIVVASVSSHRRCGSAATIFSVLMASGLIVALYALYQRITINGAADFWYVGPLESRGFTVHEFNLFRDGVPRLSSVFTSSLEFAFFTLFVFVIAYARLMLARAKCHTTAALGTFLIPITLLFLTVIMLSTVRSALVGLAIVVPYLHFLPRLKSTKAVFYSGVLLAIGLSLSTFLYLALGFTSEPSALGRLDQWREAIEIVSSSPMGLGLGMVGPTEKYGFDSLWLNLLLMFGVFASPVIAAVVFVYYRLARKICRAHACDPMRALHLAIVAVFPIFLFLSTFHAFYNSVVLYLIAVVSAVVLTRERKTNE